MHQKFSQLSGHTKDLLEMLFGKHNLESNTEPEEMLVVSRKKVQELYKHFGFKHDPTDKENEFNRELIEAKESLLLYLFHNKCLSDQPTPKTETTTPIPPNSGELKTETAENEKKPTENMEEKELNLLEILTGCENQEFYSPSFGKVTLRKIYKESGYPLYWYCSYGDIYTFSDGRICKDSESIIFPSRALYKKYPLEPVKAWKEWSESRKSKRWRAKEEELYYWLGSYWNVECNEESMSEEDNMLYDAGNYFRTETEAEELAEEILKVVNAFHKRKESDQ